MAAEKFDIFQELSSLRLEAHLPLQSFRCYDLHHLLVEGVKPWRVHNIIGLFGICKYGPDSPGVLRWTTVHEVQYFCIFLVAFISIYG